VNGVDGPGAHDSSDHEADQKWYVDPILLHDRYLPKFQRAKPRA
jgi:hypothetical protein